MPASDGGYDCIIVGGGTAGCILASRLSEGSDTEVLLLEAGRPDEDRKISIPAAYPELFDTEFEWGYRTAPQPRLNDRELYWPRGKTLGGSSSINAMVHVRGHPTDFDRWEARGNEGWGYDEVVEYFERCEADGGTGDETVDGCPLTRLRSPNELTEAFVEAGQAVGIPHNADFNRDKLAGIGTYPVVQKDGQRCSTAEAYLKPALDRSNLEVVTGALVTRVEFDGQRAVGVTYESDDETRSEAAANEIVLCGGTINSPQLLLRSGVGPADHLSEHGIPVVADRPGVGADLQDHVGTTVVFESSEPVSLDDAGSLGDLAKYFLLKRGPLTSNIAEAGAFVRTSPDLEAPDVQLMFGPAYFVRHGFEDPPSDGHYYSIGGIVLDPQSRGCIRLRSADPHADPVIDPRYLEAEEDLDVLIEALKLAREVGHAEPFDAYREREVHPGPDTRDREGFAEYIRNVAQTLYHPVGTCKMGSGDEAVVDDRLRVHGVENLRVVDASVMPVIPSGNTNAATMMIAERAADFIRKRVA